MDKLPFAIDSGPIQQNFDQLRTDRDALAVRVAALEAINGSAGFYMRLENDSATWTTGAPVKVPMDATVYDPLNGVDLANDRYTIPAGQGGWWLFEGGALQTAAMVVGITYQTTIGGGSVANWGSPVLGTWIPQGTARTVIRGSAVMRVNAGDQIFIQAAQNTGGTLTFDGIVGDFNYLRGAWIRP